MLKPFKPYIENEYPTSDGRPMAETDQHRAIMFEVIDILQRRYENEPNVYVSGNLLIFYEKGNKRRHISPDAFVVKGVPGHMRPNYLLWEEGKGPDVVIEITSRTTRTEDIKKKYDLYESTLKVAEYFLFDPLEDYLSPSMQGFRRRAGTFRPIRAVAGRLPSQTLGLHLERSGSKLRLWNPTSGEWEPTAEERLRAEEKFVEAERARADQAEAEQARLQRELEVLRKRVGERNGH